MNKYCVTYFYGEAFKVTTLDATSLAMLEGIVKRIQYDKSKPISIEQVQRVDR